ncbi:MAG: TRAP transporter small permease [Alphaproteobacteria bacterium]|jgi:TRAP-type C4-dicarboxylate transport system permease small subunit|nr:TRAP transporter small permease [Alphaproteobacteria bacterium]MBU0805015.1 TRAP transporter small permease [Alphaproteobacteria bacterium]MBU0870514.1 TRAP transporter small permease [Alphaproteobacteria bacterium]MBU1401811.1 TRAP transporter small permease [Alphaproteobacteria bacterium]MBU1591772.1 TRAP transporter small permease [Alphaproteobacteria bacterium]
MKRYVSIVEALSRLCGVASMLLIAASTLVVSQMVFMRYVLGASTAWQTEFVVYAMIASTFIGAPYVLLLKGHVSVDLLPLMIGGLGKRVLDVIAAVLSLMFCALLGWSGWHHFYEALSKGWTTDTVWALPLWIPLLPLPLGVAILCLQYIAEIYKSWSGVEVQPA